MKEQTICLTGHRVIREKESVVREKLKDMLEYEILNGYIYFAAGGARGFDALASEVVLEIKKTKYPEVDLILVLPFENQYTAETEWTEAEIRQYEDLKKRASEIIYMGKEYKRGCYHKRNRLLVRMASKCISYQTKSTGGTAYTVQCAEQAGIPVLNVSYFLKLDEKENKKG